MVTNCGRMSVRKSLGGIKDPQTPVTMYEAIRVCDNATTIQKTLNIAWRFSANPTAKNDEQYPYVLHELATNGYSGGKLLRLPQEVEMMLMGDEAFESLFNRDDEDPIPSRNVLQHLIHQNVELAVQCSMVGYR